MTNPDAVELVVVRKARNTIEAEFFANILEAAGIPAMVEGRYLQDEFAMPQKLLGLMGVAVKVRKDHLEAARNALAEARVAGDEMEEDETDEEETEKDKGEEPQPGGSRD